MSQACHLFRKMQISQQEKNYRSRYLVYIALCPHRFSLRKRQTYLVGRGPPFAYWRKVGLQAYTKICSGVLCNIVVNIVMLLHIRVVRGDNAVCVCRAAAQDMYMYCFGCGVDELGMARPSHCCSGFIVVAGQRNSLAASVTHSQTKAMFVRTMKIHIYAS